MSVVEPERHGNRLLVRVKAQELATYTVEILKNQKIFNPEIDTELIKRIRNHAAKGDGYKMLQRLDQFYHGLWEETA